MSFEIYAIMSIICCTGCWIRTFVSLHVRFLAPLFYFIAPIVNYRLHDTLYVICWLHFSSRVFSSDDWREECETNVFVHIDTPTLYLRSLVPLYLSEGVAQHRHSEVALFQLDTVLAACWKPGVAWEGSFRKVQNHNATGLSYSASYYPSNTFLQLCVEREKAGYSSHTTIWRINKYKNRDRYTVIDLWVEKFRTTPMAIVLFCVINRKCQKFQQQIAWISQRRSLSCP